MSKQYTQTFIPRWEDLDANGHLANLKYASFMIETRMGFLADNGFGYQAFRKHKLGPVILSESYHYAKEIMPSEKVTCELELLGHTPDGMFVRFVQYLYKENGNLAACGEILIAWMDLLERKLTTPPADLAKLIDELVKAENFKLFELKDTRASHIPYKKIFNKV